MNPFLLLIAVICLTSTVQAAPVSISLGAQSCEMLLLTPSHLVLGFPWADVGEDSGAGEVRVYNRSNGKLARVLRAKEIVPGHNFGGSLAYAEDQLLIGVPGDNRVDIVSLNSGKRLGNLRPSSMVGDGGFGFSIAVEGRFCYVGAPFENGARGAVYIMDLSQRVQVRKLQSGIGMFGYSVAASGGLVAIGCPTYSQGVPASSGSVFLMEGIEGLTLQQLVPTTSSVNFNFGVNVKLRGENAWISAPGGDSGRGAVFCVNAITGDQTDLLIHPDPLATGNIGFGTSLCLDDNHLVVTSVGSSIPSKGDAFFYDSRTSALLGQLNRPDTGSVLQSPIFVALQGGTLATTAGPYPLNVNEEEATAAIYPNIFSPGWDDILLMQSAATSHTGLRGDSSVSASINADGAVDFVAMLRGTGNRKAKGLFSNTGTTTLTGPLQGGVTSTYQVRDILSVRQNWSAGHLWEFVADIEAQNVKKAKSIWVTDGTLSTKQTEGLPLGPDLLDIPTKFHAVRQSYDGVTKHWGLAFSLKTGRGFASRTADSGIRVALANNAGQYVLQESANAPVRPGDETGAVYGEFAKRFSLARECCFVTGLTNVPRGTEQGLFHRRLTAETRVVARKGDEAAGTDRREFGQFAKYGTFLSEAASPQDLIAFRATLTGKEVKSTTNEGIWFDGPVQVAQKGNLVEGAESTLLWKRFLRFWVLDGQILIWGQVSGPQVTRNNDHILMLLNLEQVTWIQLLRKGDRAPGCPDARIGTVQRIEVNTTSGDYAILTSLNGTKASKNQALLVGNTLPMNPVNQLGRMLPHLLMRKGTAHRNELSSEGTVRSLKIIGPVQPSGGGTGVGEGHAISASGVVLVEVDYGKGTRRLVRAQLP